MRHPLHAPQRTRLLLLLLLCLLPLSACTQSSKPSAPAATLPPALGYVHVQAGDEDRWYPVTGDEYTVTIRRELDDGTHTENVIQFFEVGCRMASSSCANQDCVEQSEVTLYNKEIRALGSWIICLPNQVSLELYAPDEMPAQAAP